MPDNEEYCQRGTSMVPPPKACVLHKPKKKKGGSLCSVSLPSPEGPVSKPPVFSFWFCNPSNHMSPSDGLIMRGLTMRVMERITEEKSYFLTFKSWPWHVGVIQMLVLPQTGKLNPLRRKKRIYLSFPSVFFFFSAWHFFFFGYIAALPY